MLSLACCCFGGCCCCCCRCCCWACQIEFGPKNENVSFYILQCDSILFEKRDSQKEEEREREKLSDEEFPTTCEAVT